MKKRKRFLKPIAILMTVVMLTQLGGAAIAETQKEIEVCDNIDSQKTQLIINTIGDTDENEFIGISQLSLLCIFGHNIAQTTAIETNHRFWTNPTRCRRTTFRVNYCTRSSCTYITHTIISQSAIPCCS